MTREQLVDTLHRYTKVTDRVMTVALKYLYKTISPEFNAFRPHDFYFDLDNNTFYFSYYHYNDTEGVYLPLDLLFAENLDQAIDDYVKKEKEEMARQVEARKQKDAAELRKKELKTFNRLLNKYRSLDKDN